MWAGTSYRRRSTKQQSEWYTQWKASQVQRFGNKNKQAVEDGKGPKRKDFVENIKPTYIKTYLDKPAFQVPHGPDSLDRCLLRGQSIYIVDIWDDWMFPLEGVRATMLIFFVIMDSSSLKKIWWIVSNNLSQFLKNIFSLNELLCILLIIYRTSFCF